MTLVDSDFTEKLESCPTDIGATYTIAKFYEKQQLNVALNLVLYWKYLCNRGYTIKQIVQDSKNYSQIVDQIYGRYWEDIEKYMLLM